MSPRWVFHRPFSVPSNPWDCVELSSATLAGSNVHHYERRFDERCLESIEFPSRSRPTFNHQLMHLFRLVPLDEIGFPTVAGEEIGKLLIVQPGQHGGIRDLPAVEMENRQHGA